MGTGRDTLLHKKWAPLKYSANAEKSAFSGKSRRQLLLLLLRKYTDKVVGGGFFWHMRDKRTHSRMCVQCLGIEVGFIANDVATTGLD